MRPEDEVERFHIVEWLDADVADRLSGCSLSAAPISKSAFLAVIASTPLCRAFLPDLGIDLQYGVYRYESRAPQNGSHRLRSEARRLHAVVNASISGLLGVLLESVSPSLEPRRDLL
jgi:hypothetical protein